MPETIRDQKRASLINYFLVSAFLLIIDQVTKYIILKQLTAGGSIPVIKGIFHLTLVLNNGIIFGLFKNSFFISIIISFFVIAAIAILFLRFSENKSSLMKFSLSLILAGCIGNLIDRIRFGAVIDFLDFRIWPVFNIADSAISIGVALLVFGIIKKDRIKNL